MKVLVMGMNYAPESTGIAPFTTALSKELVRRGHQVTVATTFPHYPEWRTHALYRGKWFVTETLDGVSVRRTRVYLPKGSGTLERVLYDSSLSIGSFFSGLREGEVDLILAIEPPIQAGLMARMLAGLKHISYALWVQDLALEAAMSVGMMRASAAMQMAQRLEDWAHRGAGKVFVVSQGFYDNLARKGTPTSKLLFLPNWMEEAPADTMAVDNPFRHEFGICKDDVMVLHSGNMGVKQQLENVLAAAARLNGKNDICFVLVGDGSQKNSLIEYAQSAALSNVHFLPLQPQARVPQMMAAADILLVNQHPDMTEAVMPSKLLTYMSAGRPILIAAHADSEAARQVRAGDCGIVVAPNQPGALADALVLLANDPAQRHALGQRGRVFVETNFARKPLLDTFEAQLLALVERGYDA